ncbi:hypothetical protein Tco_1067625 [Tanacetum coccineum]|uniref:Uncharacterized protein n=1 Tax=Tanacetum coccineum TaxID=301880 RepID=A0ABQ5HDE4_9ASTR
MLLKALLDINSIESVEVAQKAKVLLIDGDWIDGPNVMKSVFLKHFSNQFSMPDSHRICHAEQFTNLLSLEHKEDLERHVTQNEIKRAVLDCDMNKSSGPNGFTFQIFLLNIESLNDKLSLAAFGILFLQDIT